jgi:hypothetical protein
MIAAVGFFFFFQLLGAFIVWADSLEWGEIRFRYDPNNGEVFFGKEKVTFPQKEYQKLVFGCVRGVDTEASIKMQCEVTQVFVLLLDRNDQWRRYTLSDDLAYWRTSESGSRQFVKLVDHLQTLFSFDVFVRSYSREECYAQQSGA